MALAKNQRIELIIDSIASDGNAVGRFDGQAVFIPGGTVGDKLDVKITKPEKKLAYGMIKQIITPGPGRQTPDCPVSGKCGGCSFRHMSYEAELEAKHGFVRDALRRIGNIDITPKPVLPSPLVDRYRCKVQVSVAPGADGAFSYGFFASRSHRIVPCSDCRLQPSAINKLTAHAATLLAEAGATPYDEIQNSGLVRHICVRQSHSTGGLLLCIVATQGELPRQQEFVSAIASNFPAVKSISLNVNPSKTNVIFGSHTLLLFGEARIREEISGVPLFLDALSFSQVNPSGAERLFAVAKEFAALEAGETLLDLYCGTGVIGLSMARDCARLVGVEIFPTAVESARESALAMGLTNTEFLCADAKAAAVHLAAEGLRPDVAVLDPPRKGADEATLTALAGMGPERIVMVSCNPATMARDLAFLVKSGYSVQKVQPVDMFPRTRHVECVALLEKAEGQTNI